MPEYDKNLECVSHAGRHLCNGTCRTQHSVYVGIDEPDKVDCPYFVSKDS